MTNLLQFIEPVSDWSLHLLLHLSSEQLQPLRGHHLVNTQTQTHIYTGSQQRFSCTEAIFPQVSLSQNDECSPAAAAPPDPWFYRAALLGAPPAAAAVSPAEPVCRSAGASAPPAPGSARPAGCKKDTGAESERGAAPTGDTEARCMIVLQLIIVFIVN